MAPSGTTGKEEGKEHTEGNTDITEDIPDLRVQVRDLVSAFNRHVRLRATPEEKHAWPRANLQRMERSFQSGLLPPQTPCEYVHPACAGSHMLGPDGETGLVDTVNPDSWLGHGYFYYQRPRAFTGDIANTGGGGDLNTNFDVLEEQFVRLSNATVMYADYALLRRDFPHLQGFATEADIDAWLLDATAYISEGQLRRLEQGGDHHELLGLDRPAEVGARGGENEEEDEEKQPDGKKGGKNRGKNRDKKKGVANRVHEVVDVTRRKMGIRMRAGGRAATFMADDMYGFDEVGAIQADMIDVKGCGTHVDRASKKVSHTGLLGKTDALRGLAVQKLVQRIAELEGEADVWNTVQFYGVVDTGLRYRRDVADPATGIEGEQCVLSLRQAQSRLAGVIDETGGLAQGDLAAGGGNFVLAGDTPGLCGTGTGRMVRRSLDRYGVSAEICAGGAMIDSARGVTEEAHLGEIQVQIQGELSPPYCVDRMCVRLICLYGGVVQQHVYVYVLQLGDTPTVR